MSGGKRKTITAYLIAGIIILDQLTKYWVLRNFSPGQSIPVIKNIFHLTYVLNSGAAFGILRGRVYILMLIAAAVVILILVNLRRIKLPLVKIALALILSGAVSNLIDRLRLNAVIDFLDFRVWPVFNVADSAITVGAVLLAYSVIFKKDKKAARGGGRCIR